MFEKLRSKGSTPHLTPFQRFQILLGTIIILAIFHENIVARCSKYVEIRTISYYVEIYLTIDPPCPYVQLYTPRDSRVPLIYISKIHCLLTFSPIKKCNLPVVMVYTYRFFRAVDSNMILEMISENPIWPKFQNGRQIQIEVQIYVKIILNIVI